MSLPWLQVVDPSERLPDDTKWENHDELTLWKQCKLRGMEAHVKKEGDALRILNELKNLQVKWWCSPMFSGIHGIDLPEEMAEEKGLTSLIHFMEKQTIQVLRIEECKVPSSSEPEMIIEMSDATVRFGRRKACSCGLEFNIGFPHPYDTCIHILFLERRVLKCPEHLQRVDRLNESMWEGYFANAPLAFKPRILAEGQTLSHTITDKECQLCFKEAKISDDITRCEVCCRVAHQQCKSIYRTRRAACEENTGCPLCCPNCPWNPSNPEVKAELASMEVKQEPGAPRDKPATADDAVSSAAKQKVRKLRCQLRRKPASRVMSSLRYERLAGKVGRKGAKYRRNKLIMAAKKTLKSEDAHTKDEDKASVFKEEVESPVKIIKVEKTRKVKSEPVVISLL